MKPILLFSFLAIFSISCKTDEKSSLVSEFPEKHRPQYHFTPPANWMNDPNGMVFYEGEYHLFYQYFPDGNKWGPMHWGHAISTDFVHWEHLPIALYPDSIGYIFSGSAVIDYKNTSGLGTATNPPMVAIYTYHNMEGEKAKTIDFQTQGIAFSLDKGRTWTKYEGNPVIKNPGIRDFRDPKVSWYEPDQKWVMILAVKDHTEIYSSKDLKSWKKESDFGKGIGAHGGVWECPDLFKLKDQSGIEHWVMLVSINPNGPQGGSATQYFVGNFDGKTFMPADTTTRWIDFGADNYAGVTWNNIPEKDGRRLFLGWMSNWQYAQEVPTEKWRSAMTIPRELKLKKESNGFRIISKPVIELDKIVGKAMPIQQSEFALSDSSFVITVTGTDLTDFDLRLSNEKNETYKFKITAEKLISDRTKAGINSFSEVFAAVHNAPLGGVQPKKLQLFVDASSVEIFVNDGELVMTELLFPSKPFTTLKTKGKQTNTTVSPITSIWLK